MSERVHLIVEGAGAPVRRRIVVWRRLEPGDVRSPGSIEVPESPFLEAKVVDVAVPSSVHAEMVRLAAAKAKATTLAKVPLVDYEPAGVLIAAAGGMAVGAWLDYLRPASWFVPAAGVLFAVGVVVATIAKRRRAVIEAEAQARWERAPEKEEHDALARELAQGWLRFAQDLKREMGFHVEIRVAEGSSDPLRLASIDPRPMDGAKGFDPEDWLPTEGGGVRYEALHAGGEIATRLMPGTVEVGAETETEGPTSEPEPESAAVETEAAAESEGDGGREPASP